MKESWESKKIFASHVCKTLGISFMVVFSFFTSIADLCMHVTYNVHSVWDTPKYSGVLFLMH